MLLLIHLFLNDTHFVKLIAILNKLFIFQCEANLQKFDEEK